jgi:hypothetical protein
MNNDIFNRNKLITFFLIIHILIWIITLGLQFPPNFGMMCAGINVLALFPTIIFTIVLSVLLGTTKEKQKDYLILLCIELVIPFLLALILSLIGYKAGF